MEPIFESECKYTKAVIELVQRRMMKLWVKIALVCMGIFSLRLFVVGLLAGEYQSAVFSLALCIFFVAYYFVLPKIHANTIYKQHERLYKGEAVVKVTFYENEIVANNTTTNATIPFSYNDVTKVYEKSGIYIIIAKGIAVLVDSSTIKTESDIKFHEFLQRKTLNAG